MGIEALLKERDRVEFAERNLQDAQKKADTENVSAFGASDTPLYAYSDSNDARKQQRRTQTVVKDYKPPVTQQAPVIASPLEMVRIHLPTDKEIREQMDNKFKVEKVPSALDVNAEDDFLNTYLADINAKTQKANTRPDAYKARSFVADAANVFGTTAETAIPLLLDRLDYITATKGSADEKYAKKQVEIDGKIIADAVNEATIGRGKTGKTVMEAVSGAANLITMSAFGNAFGVNAALNGINSNLFGEKYKSKAEFVGGLSFIFSYFNKPILK